MTGPRRDGARGAIAVTLHGVEPATFERCALIRDWLGDNGVDRVTLLVAPAPDLPVGDTSPVLAQWLAERVRAGDAIVRAASRDRRLTASRLLRAGAVRRREVLRLALHPSDLDRHRTVAAVEALLRRSARRRAATHDELSGA